MLPSVDLWNRARSLGARAILRHCDVIGARPAVFARPVISNLGRIEIGSYFVLSATPVPSHLATGPGGIIQIGNRVHIAHGAGIFSGGLVTIGDDTTIGPMAAILDVDFHEVNDRESVGTARPIHIGRNVRIASGVIILRGAVIGDGARVAPNSLVCRYVPAGTYAEGVPAKPHFL